ncbi:Chlorophyll a/b binding protein domain containing protein [Parasponia andersonii]|uniref:Chlorophyll a/b binding protein domain containing protein n=1 Tax=Parasponia andersonii TaxID=3476 RepID=A0A2P5BV52_PARAD|nr:Chlorophyll a/b binding protein domain containing protein [Parasponia andersonii]
MSVATSFPYIKIPSSSSSQSCSYSSSSSSHHHYPPPSSSLRISSTKPFARTLIRSSQTEGPIRRPVAPSIREPSPPSTLKPTPPSQTPSPSPSPSPLPSSSSAAGAIAVEDKNVITLEFQRLKAKELQEYFKKKKKLEEANQGPFFGFIGKNEINNGRWAMFGFAVGLLTEYATGSDLVDQVKILLSNFGIVDLE